MKSPFIVLQYCLPQRWLTELVARAMRSKNARLKNFLIHWFIKKYQIDLSDAADTNLDHYASFNDFFIRRLRMGTRPLGEAAILAPSDGALSEYGWAKNGKLLQAKKQSYSVTRLLGTESEFSSAFQQAAYFTVYLAPKDYHRVHLPCQGRLLKTVYVPGRLFSVNLQTAAEVDQLFARNERLICFFETPYGRLAYVMVGAMMVAGISTVWAGDVQRGNQIQVHDYRDKNISFERGAEIGHFKFGSTVILLFASESIGWLSSLKQGQVLKIGQDIGEIKK